MSSIKPLESLSSKPHPMSPEWENGGINREVETMSSLTIDGPEPDQAADEARHIAAAGRLVGFTGTKFVGMSNGKVAVAGPLPFIRAACIVRARLSPNGAVREARDCGNVLALILRKPGMAAALETVDRMGGMHATRRWVEERLDELARDLKRPERPVIMRSAWEPHLQPPKSQR